MSLVHCVIGTAGHIDHGKTRLVKALTGIDCDVLDEEKRRGITIDIGFARMRLDNGQIAGVVDVPGHQRFIHNMLAGAAGINIALIVVAADDAVMPQTVEHLAILEILGVKKGVVALTKCDLVDKETLAIAEMDIAELLKNSSFATAMIIPCSSSTGEGVEKLRKELSRLAEQGHEMGREGFFRMPVDRVFTIKGHGAVVTGTVFSGSVAVDDRLTIVPGDMDCRVRRIQNHGETANRAEAGTRTALNLSGVDKEKITRGSVVCHQSIARKYKMFTAEIICHSSSPLTIVHGRSYILHIHTAETMCRVYLSSDKSLKPGERCVGQIRFEDPVNILYGDRFVLRTSSASHTLGGGMALEPGGKPMGRRGLKQRKKKWDVLTKGIHQGIESCLEENRGGVLTEEIMAVFNLPKKALGDMRKDIGDTAVFDWKGASYIYRKVEGEKIVENITGAITKFHEKQPALFGIEESQLAQIPTLKDMGETLAAYWIRRAVSSKKIEYKGGLLRLPGRDAKFHGDDENVRSKILEAFKEGGLNPPKTDKVYKQLGLKNDVASKIIRVLVQAGDLVSLAPDYTLHRDILDKSKETLIREIDAKGSIDTATYRDILGVGRKTAIEILEHFDRNGVTKRVDNKGKRTLKTGYINK